MKEIIAYMCKTDFDHDINGLKGAPIYSTIEDLKDSSPCVVDGGCGIVKLRVSLLEVVQEENFRRDIWENFNWSKPT